MWDLASIPPLCLLAYRRMFGLKQYSAEWSYWRGVAVAAEHLLGGKADIEWMDAIATHVREANSADPSKI